MLVARNIYVCRCLCMAGCSRLWLHPTNIQVAVRSVATGRWCYLHACHPAVRHRLPAHVDCPQQRPSTPHSYNRTAVHLQTTPSPTFTRLPDINHPCTVVGYTTTRVHHGRSRVQGGCPVTAQRIFELYLAVCYTCTTPNQTMWPGFCLQLAAEWFRARHMRDVLGN